MKTLKTILSITFLFVYIIAKSQITTNENPISFTQSNIRSVAKVMEITPPNMQKVYAEDKEKTSGVLNRIAVAVPVNLSIEKDGEWEQLPNGDKLWKLTLSVKNALFLDASFDKFWLPKGGKFFVYNRQTRQVIGAITDEFLRGTRQNPSDFATAMIKGDEITLEYYQPFNCKEFPIINTSKLYYGYKNISVFSRSSGTGFGTSDSCNINVNCKEGKKWQDEKKAIALVVFTTSTHKYSGSGALLNNTANNLEPLFLTAHHNLERIFDAINNPVMSLYFLLGL